MSYLDAVLLGLLQGITEFLPISSSGHLVLGEAVLGVKSSGMVFEVALHLATAGAVILAYRKRLRGMLTALPLMFRPRLWKKAAADSTLSPVLRENLILDWYILLGTLPAAAAGLLFKDLVESAFSSVRLVCLMLMVTGMILLSSRFARKDNHRGLSGSRSLGVGLAQAVALIPGISRSGTTITAGLLLGLAPVRAAEFSFLLALPAIFGAALLEALSLGSSTFTSLPGAGPLAAGVAAAFFSGFAAIYLLLRILQKGRFNHFAYYCLAVGLAGWLASRAL
ncbi:MAG: hypothetical protein A3F83_06225 [Candidatus Glassbacteria bacterium RIFCSPLOWO2_12_FULL_58_11]|uniref:Undecaprenyl-diphosphatase n=1 Tax=Candidatus Glassbacteria bacterium RIFCSPLOWO2_12_FULL_58_11 TaxID=1817867 RepID=A0A1F5Z2F8_9BACT|nr:MAG: hypothetical protein A3F83_06225 [Candidatus Glassbacteria bacterium RIFCSPLOWO2_12_FULL_58_11]